MYGFNIRGCGFHKYIMTCKFIESVEKLPQKSIYSRPKEGVNGIVAFRASHLRNGYWLAWEGGLTFPVGSRRCKKDIVLEPSIATQTKCLPIHQSPLQPTLRLFALAGPSFSPLKHQLPLSILSPLSAPPSSEQATVLPLTASSLVFHLDPLPRTAGHLLLQAPMYAFQEGYRYRQ